MKRFIIGALSALCLAGVSHSLPAQEEQNAANALPSALSLYLQPEKRDWQKLEAQNPLTIKLCDPAHRNYCRAPSQPLRLEGRKISGVAFTPPMKGEWRYDYGYGMTFTPAEPWTPNRTYRIAVAEDALPPFLKLESHSVTVESEPVRPVIGSMTYMQDPSDITRRFVATQVTFNYPMNPASVEPRLRFQYEGGTEQLPFTAVWDGAKQEVNITTPIGALLDNPRFLRLTLEAGMETKNATGKLAEVGDVAKGMSQRVEIPGRASFLAVQNAEARIVKNAKYVPEQILVLEFNAPVKPEDALAHLEVLELPRDKPSAVEGQSPRKHHKWQSLNEVTDAVRDAAHKIELTSLPVAGEAATMLSFRYAATPGRYLALTLSDGMPSEGDFILGKPYSRIVQTPGMPKEVTIQSEGALLSLSGERKLSIVTLGVKELDVELARIPADRIAHLVSQTRGDFARPEFLDEYRFNQYSLAEVFHETIPLAEIQGDAPQFTGIDLNKYLNKSLFGSAHQGLFLLTVKEKDGSASDRRLVLLSDLGFMTKQNLDGTRDVFVMDISSGDPVSGAEVQVIGLNGNPALTVKTGGQGRVTLPNLAGYENERKPVALLVRDGHDLSFMPFDRADRELNTSKFDVEGTRNSGEGLQAFLFSDRGFYRPGEEVRMGMIVRQAKWAKSMEGLPLWLDIRNSRGQIVESRLLILNAEGFLDFAYQSREDGATGVYQATVSLARGDDRGSELGNGTFRVEEFQPDTMKISAELSQPAAEGWLNPEDLSATVTLQHLFGDPAANRRMAARIALTPGEFTFKSLPEFRFHNAARAEKTFEETLPEQVTDGEGKATFDLGLTKYGNATYRLAFFAEGFEPNSGRSVKTLKTALVSSLPYVVGYKADGDLGYIPLNSPRKVTFRAVDHTLKPVAADGLTLTTLRLDRIAALTKRDDGTLAYDTKIKETRLDTKEFAIGELDTVLELNTAEPGGYGLVVKNRAGVVLARVDYQVIGNGNVTGALTRDAALDIRLSKENYKRGEDIEVAVLAPYTGAGIITLETDKVETFRWFKAETLSSVQTLPVPENFEGKGFVSVHFIRGLDSKEIFATPFAYAVKAVTVDLDQRLNTITLSAPDVIKPGETLPITYQTEVPGKIVVFAVDEGILNFARYQLPDPLSFFFMGRALEVATSQIFDLIMPEYSILKALSASGGDGWINDGKNLNPFKRKTEPPVACWSGILEASANAKVYECPVPTYFNGAVRVMAVGVAAESLGSGQRTALVKGPFIISPNAPLFVAPGDVFEASVTVRNNRQGSGAAGKVALSVTPSEQLELVDAVPSELAIGEGKEETLTFRVRALEKLGSASLSFKAGSGDSVSVRDITLSVRPATPRFTEIRSGYAQGPDVTQTVESGRTLYPELSHGEAVASSLPVSLIPALAQYLDEFPYGCTEQLASKAMPYVALVGAPEFLKGLHLADQTAQDRAMQMIGALRDRQADDGGFARWTATSEPEDFLTVYVAHLLTIAREKQLPVSDDMWDPLLRALRNNAARVPVSLADARNKAHAIYLLVRNGEVAANYLPPVVGYLEQYEPQALKQDVAALYIASAYQLMQMTPEAEAIVSRFTPKPPSASVWYGDYDSHLIQTAQIVYLKALHFKQRFGEADRALVFQMANAIGNREYNTLASSFSILAFDAYAKLSSDREVVKNVFLTSSGYDGQPVTLRPEGERMLGAVFEQPVRSVTFKAESPLGLFYQFTTSGFDKGLVSQPVENGLEVSRRYLDATGAPVTAAKVGDEVTVELTIRSGSNDTVENVAVVDLLPGGFEPVNPETPANAEEGAAAAPNPQETAENPWVPLYASYREDRVLAFGSADATARIHRYKIKAVSRGTFMVPPAYAEDMYRLDIRARGASGIIRVD